MKGQLSALDALVAIVLFVGMYSILIATLSNIDLGTNEFESLAIKSELVSAHLLTSSGEPTSWTPSNVFQIGLVMQRGVIESEKLGNFLKLFQTDINKAKQLLGISGLNFFYNVTFANGTAVFVNSSNFNGFAVIGSDFDSRTMATKRTVAIYNGSRVFVNLKIGSD